MNLMSETIADLAKALAAAQSDLNPASKNAKNPMLKNRYADLASCISAAREVLPKHGLSYSQVIEQCDKENCIAVRTILMHESGQWISSVCTLSMFDSKGELPKGVNRAQAAGSIITYARRYGLSSIIGLATDDDDDGCAGATPDNQRYSQQKQQMPIGQMFQWALRNAGAKDINEAITMAVAFIGRDIKELSEVTEEEMRKYINSRKEKSNGVSE